MSSRTRLGTWLIAATFFMSGSVGVAVAVAATRPADEPTRGIGEAVSAAPQPQGATTPVRVDADHHAHLATHVRPGVHRLLVTAEQAAVLQLVRPEAGYTRTQAAADIGAAYGAEGDQSAWARFESRTTTLGGVSASPGHTGELWQTLSTGTYWVLDTKAGTYTADDLTVVTVAGRPVSGVLTAETTLTIGADDTWAARPRSVEGSGVVRVVNRGTRDHAVTVVRLRPGRSDQALSTGTLSPGSSMVVGYSLRPGRYVLLGWWPDAQGVGNDRNGLERQIRIR